MEEFGCASISTSYVTFIIFYLPQAVFSLITAILSLKFLTSAKCVWIKTCFPALTLHRFRRHRAEMNEMLSSHSDVTPNNYIRMMMITFTMLLFHIPILILIIILPSVLIADQKSALESLHTSWAPGHNASLSVIHLVSSQELDGMGSWTIFSLKWSEWIFVLDAILFFSIFGTTSQAMRRYRAATSYILEKIGLKKKEHPSMAASDIMFSSNPRAPRRQPVR